MTKIGRQITDTEYQTNTYKKMRTVNNNLKIIVVAALLALSQSASAALMTFTATVGQGAHLWRDTTSGDTSTTGEIGIGGFRLSDHGADTQSPIA
jgi:hypothetical protein